MLLHAEAATHGSFYTQNLLHTDAFTQRSFLDTEASTHRRFYTQKLHIKLPSWRLEKLEKLGALRSLEAWRLGCWMLGGLEAWKLGGLEA